MTGPTPDSSQLSAARRVAVAALAAAVVAAPLCLGSTPAWPRFALEATMAAAVVVWACSGPIPRWGWIVPLGVTAVLALQLVPLPSGLVAWLAPVSAGKWVVANGGMRATWNTVSIDPAATAVAARRLFIALATSAAMADMSRVAACRRWLAGAVSLAAVLVLATGWLFPVRNKILLGRLDLNGPLEHWLTPLESPLATAGFGYNRWVTVGTHRYLTVDAATPDGFGCYLNSNHFAGALCLAWPVALGAWLWCTRGRLPDIVRWGFVAAAIALAVWTAGGMAHSRAGSAALLFGSVVFVSLAATHRWVRIVAAAGVACAAIGIVAFVAVFLGGFTGTGVVEVLPAEWRPRAAGILHDPRIAASAAAMRMFRASPLLGTGMDTYGEMAKPTAANGERLFFAHNDYAQLLAETGLLGAGLAIAFAILCAMRLRAFVRAAPSDTRPLEAGAWAALAALAVHSCFDWNLHVPANAFLACVNVGLAFGGVVAGLQAASRQARPPAPSDQAGWGGRMAAFGLAAACVAAVALLWRDACSERTQRSLRVAVTAGRRALQDGDRPVNPAALAAAIDAGDRMARWDPGNPRLAALLGRANLHLAAVEPAGDAAARVAVAERLFAQARRNAATFVDIDEPVAPSPSAAAGVHRRCLTAWD